MTVRWSWNSSSDNKISDSDGGFFNRLDHKPPLIIENKRHDISPTIKYKAMLSLV